MLPQLCNLTSPAPEKGWIEAERRLSHYAPVKNEMPPLGYGEKCPAGKLLTSQGSLVLEAVEVFSLGSIS